MMSGRGKHSLVAVAHGAPLFLTRAMLVGVAALVLNTCETGPTPRQLAGTTRPADQALRENLAELAKGHRDKVQFAWYATTWHRLDPPVQDFAKRMGEENKRLYDQLNAWAKKHKMDLTFRYDEDVPGRARKAMEKEQEAVIRGDGGPDFQRDLLMMMWSDYDWQEHLAEVMAKQTTDPELKAYLEANAAMLKEGVKEIRGLLAKYRFER